MYLTSSNLIHGMNIYNDLQIKSKNKLDKDYDDRKNKTNSIEAALPTYNSKQCIFSNHTLLLNKPENTAVSYYRHIHSQITTNIIPNIINRYSFEDNKEVENNYLVEYIESILYTFIPLLIIIFTIVLITKCRKIRMKRVRPVVSLAQLRLLSTEHHDYQDLNSSIDSSTAIINSIV
jgi:hypothetical protein